MVCVCVVEGMPSLGPTSDPSSRHSRNFCSHASAFAENASLSSLKTMTCHTLLLFGWTTAINGITVLAGPSSFSGYVSSQPFSSHNSSYFSHSIRICLGIGYSETRLLVIPASDHLPISMRRSTLSSVGRMRRRSPVHRS